MNIMNRLTWRSMVKNRTRTVVTAVGIALSAALFCAVITLGTSILHYMIELQIFKGGDYHVYSTAVLPDHAECFKKYNPADYTAEVQIMGTIDPEKLDLGFYNGVIKACTPEYLETIPTGLQIKSGRLPNKAGEMVIDERLMEALKAVGYSAELGQILRLPVLPEMRFNNVTYTNPDFVTDEDGDDIPETVHSYEIACVLVGITAYEDQRSALPGEVGWEYIHIFVEPVLPKAVYHNFYLRAENIYDSEELAEAVNGKVNYGLLQYYGISESSTVTFVLLALVGLVIGITFLCAVSLISNSFAISVAQRTRELGLLASVGATRKQLRQSVRFEAVALCLLAIPLGLLLGLGAAALAVSVMGDGVVSLFAANATGLRLGLMIEPWGLAIAASVAAATVFLSAWLPSRRSAKISPIEAIRQHRDYKTPKRLPRISRFGMRKPKLPALMARKYYRTSRSSYLPTIVSLGISVALLLSTAAATSGIQTYADSVDVTQNCHFNIEILDGDTVLLEELQNHVATEKSVVYRVQTEKPVILDSQISEERINAGAGLEDWVWPAFEVKNRKEMVARIHYLEDSAFNSFLIGQELLPAPYYSQTKPQGVIFLQRSAISTSADEVAEEYRDHIVDGKYVDEFPLFTDDVEKVFLIEQEPELDAYMARQLKDVECDGFWTQSSGYDYLEDGQMIWWATFRPLERRIKGETGEQYMATLGKGMRFRFLVKEETNAEGETVNRFYPYDVKENEKASTVILYGDVYTPPKTNSGSNNLETDTSDHTYLAELSYVGYDMGIGDTVAKVPYGLLRNVRDYDWLCMLRPLSTLPEGEETTLHISLNTNNYPLTVMLLENLASEGRIEYFNYVEEEYLSRVVRDMVDAFCYTFVALMTVIATGNVFNTMSTNILLRRRDFGILRSVGMSRRSIRAMVAAESLHCGIRALLFSVPLGLAVGYFITTIIQQTVKNHTYSFPLTTLLLAVGCVLIVVLVSMFYALQRIRNDNPIDAIRMENT